MKWLGVVIGGLLSLMGIVWILQGFDILKAGFMAGHLRYAAFGVVVLAVGLVLAVWSYRRPSKTSGGA